MYGSILYAHKWPLKVQLSNEKLTTIFNMRLVSLRVGDGVDPLLFGEGEGDEELWLVLFFLFKVFPLKKGRKQNLYLKSHPTVLLYM